MDNKPPTPPITWVQVIIYQYFSFDHDDAGNRTGHSHLPNLNDALSALHSTKDLYERVKQILCKKDLIDMIQMVEELEECLIEWEPFTSAKANSSLNRDAQLREECVRVLLKNLEFKGFAGLTAVNGADGADVMDGADMMRALLEPVGTSSLGPWKLLSMISYNSNASSNRIDSLSDAAGIVNPPSLDQSDGTGQQSSNQPLSSATTPKKKKLPVGANSIGKNSVLSAAVAAQEAAAAQALAEAAASTAAVKQNNPYTNNTIANAPLSVPRVDDATEIALAAHFSELSVQGMPSENVEALVDPYEQELDVYTTLSPVVLMQNLFSHMTPDQIEQVLEAHHYNIEDTMDALFTFQSSGDGHDDLNNYTHSSSSFQEQQQQQQFSYQAQSVPLNPRQAASKQVCRHFLLGQCYRSDCWYSHDPEVVLCKFWLKGRCYKGETCEFSHGEGLEQTLSSRMSSISVVGAGGMGASSSSMTSGGPTGNAAPPSLDDFPALGASSTTSTSNKTSKPTIDFWAPSASYNDALKKKQQPSAADVQAQKMAQAAAQIQAEKRKEYLRSLDSADWVQTGTVVNNRYLEVRKDAIDVALNRNKLFQQATEAYLSGNKAAARALSLSAHQLNSQVSQLHAQASTKIFRSRNPTHALSKGIIDLHGLHPNEGVEMLDSALAQLLDKKFRGKVVVIVGTGHHSRGRVKVGPAIQRHLERNGWRPKEACMSDGRGGMFVINL